MKPIECPRCEGKDITSIGRSPKEGVWELFRCDICQYVWRSTESEDMLTSIRLREDEIREIPTVPPLWFKE